MSLRLLFNSLAALEMFIIVWAIIFAGVKPFGWSGSAIWASFFLAPLVLIWGLLARISGLANLIVFTIILSLSFFSPRGIVNYTSNITPIAEFFRYDSKYAELRKEIFVNTKKRDWRGDMHRQASSELEKSWNTYGTYINPWYTPQRFQATWNEFSQWFSSHKYPDERPPYMPYFGSEESIDDRRTYNVGDDLYHPDDKHKDFNGPPGGLL